MKTWVIGAGGLFGSALVRASDEAFVGPAIPWADSDAALHVLKRTLIEFTSRAGPDWCIAWAAGHATTSSDQEQANTELVLFQRFVETLKDNTPEGNGVFLLTSSAGGVFAGSSCPPFRSSSTAQPVGIYGHLKLAQEHAAEVLAPFMPVVTARISNLYGPGQDLTKLQGVISRLALAAITREPITMFVPLDTMRDYIYADDAAARALHWAELALQERQSATRVVASGQPETLGHVIALMSDVTRVRIPIASGIHESASAQARDLRLVPDSDSTTARLPITPLPAGMKRVYLDISRRHAAATLVG